MTGLELIIDKSTGEVFASQRGYARMANKTQSTINSRIVRMNKSERKSVIKTAEIQTEKGVQGVQGGELIDENLMYEWVGLVGDLPSNKLILLS